MELLAGKTGLGAAGCELGDLSSMAVIGLLEEAPAVGMGRIVISGAKEAE